MSVAQVPAAQGVELKGPELRVGVRPKCRRVVRQLSLDGPEFLRAGRLALRLSLWQERRALERSTAVVTHSERSRDIMIGSYGVLAERIEVFPNPSALRGDPGAALSDANHQILTLRRTKPRGAKTSVARTARGERQAPLRARLREVGPVQLRLVVSPLYLLLTQVLGRGLCT